MLNYLVIVAVALTIPVFAIGRWCDPCMGGSDKRDGYVSWIHMIV